MIHHPSPNFGPRRNGERPELVVLHYTEMASAEAARDRLCCAQAEVSAHYLIGRDGTLWQLVDEAARAWHAGAGAWQGRGDVNSRSIGIELDNDGQTPFSAPLMLRLEVLLRQILTRWDIPATGVIAHSDMAPLRKIDPGPRFDWQRLARQNLSIWPEIDGNPNAPLNASLDVIGYPEAAPEARLKAFRLRFRPTATGPESAADRASAAAVAKLCQTFEN
ncbi:N-acetylmuramoyl-L-alanine amidase [Pararhodobacter oceanensis]|uniref:N-acetylmuramoyl-L-alanine amidase n=1 Tax=Pararhodobacter oceanensis TaxID=2172121 RepID=UPI003A8E13B6